MKSDSACSFGGRLSDDFIQCAVAVVRRCTRSKPAGSAAQGTILQEGARDDRRPRHRDQRHVHKSFEDAIAQGVARATKTLRNVRSAWVKEQRIEIENGQITGYQVNMLVTFILDD